MIRAVLKDEAFLRDVKSADVRDGHFALWWLGQSGFLVQWNGRHLLIDPYLSDSLTQKYADTDKPHVRMSELVVQPARLDFIDIVTSSHSHTDHLDADTLIPLREVNPGLSLVVPAANVQFAAQRLRCDASQLVAIREDQPWHRAGFSIHAIPSAHETVERDEQGQSRYVGYVVEFGGWTLYHSGDTVRYEGLEEKLRQWRIDVALLPINGRGAERRVAGNLWGREAAQLANQIHARYVIPCHYDMFTFNTATTDEFQQSAEALGQAHTILRGGQRWTSRCLSPNL